MDILPAPAPAWAPAYCNGEETALTEPFTLTRPPGTVFTGAAFLAMVTGFTCAMLALFLMTTAYAGEINDHDGFAIKGRDPVAYFTLGKAVEGSKALTLQYKGSTFRFASAANRDVFKAAPESYAPQYGGFCAYGTSRGYKADIDPEAFTITNGKLYLNYSKKIQAEWTQDIPGFVARADANWPAVLKTDTVYR
jgi:YHS domain-containing protein